MSAQCEVTAKAAAGNNGKSAMSLFVRWLTLWGFLCIVAGIALGQFLPAPFQALGRMEVARVNIPVGLLLGISSITVPWGTPVTSAVLYIVIPLALAQLWRKSLLAKQGTDALRRGHGEARAVVDRGAARHPGAAVRLPGPGHPRTAAGDRAAGGMHRLSLGLSALWGLY